VDHPVPRFRNALLPLAVLLALAPRLAAAKGLAFVLNSADATITEIDVSSQKVVRTVPVLREPHHMALTPDGKSLLVGDTSGNAIFYLDPDTGAVQRQIVAADPYQLQFSPNRKYLTVTGLARDQIDIYDAASMHLLHRISLPRSMPSHINYLPDSSRVFVSLQQSNKLIAIEPESGRIVWNTDVGRTPAGVLWNDGHLLVGIYDGAYIAQVDPADGHVLRRIATGRGAHNMFVTPDGKTIYVTNRIDGTISVIDPHTLDKLRDLRIPGGPDDIDFGPDGKLWTALRWQHAVAVVDPVTGDFTKIPVGRSPHGIWLNTHGRGDGQQVSLNAH
jgi:YVTN family beta-propeller protein